MTWYQHPSLFANLSVMEVAYITSVGQESGIMNVFLDQFIFDIAELIVWFIPVQDFAIKDVFPSMLLTSAFRNK